MVGIFFLVAATFVYVDESGDLGAPNGSSFITIAALATQNRLRIERIPQKIRKKRLKKNLFRKPELKFHNSDDRIREMVLSMLVKEHDFQIVAITINKKKAGRGLQSMKDEFFNHFCAVLAVEILKMNPSENDFIFVFDERPKSRDSNIEFESYIYERIRHEFIEVGITPPKTLASRLDSQKSRGLQVVDFVVGAIHKKYESNESKFYDVISDSISREMRFFF